MFSTSSLFFFFYSYDSRAGIEDSKKWGMLFLVNQLFKIYFKVGFKSYKLFCESNSPFFFFFFLHDVAYPPFLSTTQLYFF